MITLSHLSLLSYCGLTLAKRVELPTSSWGKLLLSGHFSLKAPSSTLSHPSSWAALTSVILFLLICHIWWASSPSEIPKHTVRFVFRKSKKIMPLDLLSSELYWLPVKFWVECKIATLAFRCFDICLPPYLSSLLKIIYQPSHSLGSSNEELLRVARVSTLSNTSLVWNYLPEHIRNADKLSAFKPQLKSSVFQKSFC